MEKLSSSCIAALLQCGVAVAVNVVAGTRIILTSEGVDILLLEAVVCLGRRRDEIIIVLQKSGQFYVLKNAMV